MIKRLAAVAKFPGQSKKRSHAKFHCKTQQAAFGAGTHRAVRQANRFLYCPVALNRLCNGGSWKLADCAHPPPATTVHVAYMLFLLSSSHLNRAEGVFFLQQGGMSLFSGGVAVKKARAFRRAGRRGSGRASTKRQTCSTPQTIAASATDAPCDYACRGVCMRFD